MPSMDIVEFFQDEVQFPLRGNQAGISNSCYPFLLLNSLFSALHCLSKTLLTYN